MGGRVEVSKLSGIRVIVPFLALLAMAPAYGQGYPSRAVKVVVPFPPGPSDTLARLYGQSLSQQLGQTFIIENRTGATGTVGAAVVAHAAPDGYTLLSSPDLPIVKAPNLVKVPYDPTKDFEPVAIVGEDSNILVASQASGLKSLADLVAAAKAKPGTISFGSAGTGSPGHLCGEMIAMAAGIKLSHIPYRGAGPATAAVLSGEVQLFCGPVAVMLPNIRAGKLTPLAVTGTKPLAQLPNVKPLAATWPGLSITTWYGFLAPAGTPAPVVDVLRRALPKAGEETALRTKLTDAGIDPAWIVGADAHRRIVADLARWDKVIEAAHIQRE